MAPGFQHLEVTSNPSIFETLSIIPPDAVVPPSTADERGNVHDDDFSFGSLEPHDEPMQPTHDDAIVGLVVPACEKQDSESD